MVVDILMVCRAWSLVVVLLLYSYMYLSIDRRLLGRQEAGVCPDKAELGPQLSDGVPVLVP